MDNPTKLAKAIVRRIQKISGGQSHAYGVWVAAESVDSNLSQVRFAGAGAEGQDVVARFVPKLAHVSGLTTSSIVLCTVNPLCIIGIRVGNITLAEA